MSEPFFIPRLAIFGVGLIGGSLCLALKEQGLVGSVIGVGRSQANLEKAISLGVIDEIESDPTVATQKADVIVLATPVNTIVSLLEKIAPFVDEEKVITDVGSVKGEIALAAEGVLGDLSKRFIPGHPIAGAAKSGVEAANSALFQEHKVVLTPLPSSDQQAHDMIHAMWEKTGADVVSMDTLTHDRVLSLTSHLPHVLSYAMMNFLAASDEKAQCYEMVAGGFCDFTRTASADPEMWTDISMMNRKQLVADITAFRGALAAMGEMIEKGEDELLRRLFESAKHSHALVTDPRKNEHNVT